MGKDFGGTEKDDLRNRPFEGQRDTEEKLIAKMSGLDEWDELVAALKSWPALDIDKDGTFKYVLIEVSAYVEGQEEQSKLLVRGHAWGEYHADIYDKEEEALRAKGLDAQ